MVPKIDLATRTIEHWGLKLHVSVKEERNTIPFLIRGDHTVSSAAVVPVSVAVHKITNVDHKGVLLGRDRDPCLSGWIPDFEAFGTKLLQENGNAAKIGMRANFCSY